MIGKLCVLGLAALLGMSSCRNDVAGNVNLATSPTHNEADLVEAWVLRSTDGHYQFTLQRAPATQNPEALPAVEGFLIDFRQNHTASFLSLSDTLNSGNWEGGLEFPWSEPIPVTLALGQDLTPGTEVAGSINEEQLRFSVSPLALQRLLREREDVNTAYGDSISGSYRLSVVQLRNDKPAAARINDSLWAAVGMRPNVPKDAARVMEDSLSAWSKLHNAMLAGAMADMAEEDEGTLFGFNEAIDRSQRVLIADDTLLTVATTDYVYSGGAHGNYGIFYQSFDRRSGEMLRLDMAALSVPERRRLALALKVAALDMFGKSPDEELEGELFVKTIPLTDNVGRVPGGWLFGYVPYEIGPYSAGQIELLVWDREWR